MFLKVASQSFQVFISRYDIITAMCIFIDHLIVISPHPRDMKKVYTLQWVCQFDQTMVRLKLQIQYLHNDSIRDHRCIYIST